MGEHQFGDRLDLGLGRADHRPPDPVGGGKVDAVEPGAVVAQHAPRAGGCHRHGIAAGVAGDRRDAAADLGRDGGHAGGAGRDGGQARGPRQGKPVGVDRPDDQAFRRGPPAVRCRPARGAESCGALSKVVPSSRPPVLPGVRPARRGGPGAACPVRRAAVARPAPDATKAVSRAPGQAAPVPAVRRCARGRVEIGRIMRPAPGGAPMRAVACLAGGSATVGVTAGRETADGPARLPAGNRRHRAGADRRLRRRRSARCRPAATSGGVGRPRGFRPPWVPGPPPRAPQRRQSPPRGFGQSPHAGLEPPKEQEFRPWPPAT